MASKYDKDGRDKDGFNAAGMHRIHSEISKKRNSAESEEDVKNVQLLLDARVNVNLACKEGLYPGCTPLHIAVGVARAPHLTVSPIAKLLLDRKASVDAEDKLKERAVH